MFPQPTHKIKREFFNTAVADILKALDGGSFIGSFILCFCLIDQLAWIEFGDEKYAFNKWIKKRLVGTNPLYEIFDQDLFEIRSGLIHTYGPSRKMEMGKKSGYRLTGITGLHLTKVTTDHLHINIYYLLSDCLLGAHLTFEEIVNNPKGACLTRAQKQIKNGYGEPPVNYAKMHKSLTCFDNDIISINTIRASLTEYFLEHDKI